MRSRQAIDLADEELLIFFPYNRENNRALREYTRATDLQWDRRRHAYCLSAAAADSPEVCHNLRGFASRRGLRLNRAAAARLGAFVTRTTIERLCAEIHAIDRKLEQDVLPNPEADGEKDRREGLGLRRDELNAMLTWPAFPHRPDGCRIASPGSLFHCRYDDGEESVLLISAADIEGYDRISPMKPIGTALSTGHIGDHVSLGKGRGSLTILDITD